MDSQVILETVNVFSWSLLGLMFIFYLIPCFVCATAADRKGLSPIAFFLFSFIFTPVLGFLAVIAMNPE